MTTFVALLRAVNVGDTTCLAMKDLSALCEGLGLENVRTHIQSGNVVFDCSWTPSRVKASLETALATRLKKHVDVLVRSAREMAAALERNPFSSAPANKVYVLFFDRPPPQGALAAITIPGREEVWAAGREVYVHYPDGMGRSKLKLDRLGVATARNINTVARLAAMGAA